MAKRIKSDKTILRPVPDWQHADDFVRRIGDLTMQINGAEHKATDDINEIKAELAEKVKPRQETIKQYLRSLEVFATTHKDDFKKAKSRKLNFGILGWRTSTFIKIKKNTLERIKQVFSSAKAKVYIRVKEAVDKDALAKLTDEQLANIGARREEKDVFFVELNLPKAVDYVE